MGRKRILVGVLNWGLGHATRSVPVIRALKERDFEPVIASDGTAGKFLRQYFPQLPYIELPGWRVVYPRMAGLTPVSLAMQSLSWYRLYKRELELTQKIIKEYRIEGIISDNRPGIYSQAVPSVYITHQLHVRAGMFTSVVSAMHRKRYEKYDEIWVPDRPEPPYLSGILGHPEKKSPKIKYIGLLSRFNYEPEPDVKDTEYLIVLSGPEKQRTMLENYLLTSHRLFGTKVTLVRGTSKPVEKQVPSQWKIIDFADTLTLKNLILRAEKLILRSGYSSIMDLVALRKKAVLIPTPGQKEQEYLAEFLEKQKMFPSVAQQNINKIPEIHWQNYKLPEIPVFRPDFKIFSS